jgi:hypothetical protein
MEEEPKISVALTEGQWTTIAFLLGFATRQDSGVVLHEPAKEAIESLVSQVEKQQNALQRS